MAKVKSKYCTTAEAAIILGAGRASVGRMCRRGTIPAQKFGRVWQVDREGLAEYMERSEGLVKTDPRRRQ